MIGPEDAPFTYEYPDYYKIVPSIASGASVDWIKSGALVPENFCYASNTNNQWMSSAEIIAWIETNKTVIGKI